MAINWMEPFEKLIKLLKISGFWLDKSSSKCWIVIAVILHIGFVELFAIFGIIYLANVKNIEDFSSTIGMVPLYIVTCIKSIHWVANKNKIESMMKDMKDLIEENSWIEKQNGSKLKKRIRQVVKISNIFLSSAMTGVFLGSLIPLFSHELPLKVWIPYDYSNNEVLFWLTVAYQDVVSYCVVPVMVTFETIPIFFMCYLTGIIEELCDRMEKICDVKVVKIVKIEPKSDLSENEKLVGRLRVERRRKSQTKVEPKAGTSQMNEPKQPKKDENLEELLKGIKIQQKVKKLTSEVGDVFGKIIWLQGFMSTLVLCTSVFSLTIVS
jgi:7tm Odorant receptor